MKIAVFHCPSGITGEGVLQALRDAGLFPSSFKKELGKKSFDRKLGNRLLRVSEELGRARISGKAAVDALRYVAVVALALRKFGIEKCFVRRLAIGKKGNPSTLKLLRGFILERLGVNRELVTPSGAAIVAALCEKDDSIPAMRFESMGEGPKELRITLGETVAPFRRERILLLETNIDDMSPQGFELLYERLFKAGALDVWVEPILMKKMRPAFKLSVLLDHADRERVSETIFQETPSLGVRFLELDRFTLPRKSVRMKTRFGAVRLKVGLLDSKHSIVSPEYEDVKRIAEQKKLPFARVYQIALAAGRKVSGNARGALRKSGGRYRSGSREE